MKNIKQQLGQLSIIKDSKKIRLEKNLLELKQKYQQLQQNVADIDAALLQNRQNKKSAKQHFYSKIRSSKFTDKDVRHFTHAQTQFDNEFTQYEEKKVEVQKLIEENLAQQLDVKQQINYLIVKLEKYRHMESEYAAYFT